MKCLCKIAYILILVNFAMYQLMPRKSFWQKKSPDKTHTSSTESILLTLPRKGISSKKKDQSVPTAILHKKNLDNGVET